MLGDRRRSQPQQFHELADAELLASESHEDAQTPRVAERLPDRRQRRERPLRSGGIIPIIRHMTNYKPAFQAVSMLALSRACPLIVNYAASIARLHHDASR